MKNRLPILAALTALGGCVEVNGGAVELSWVVRTADGQAVSGCGCAEPRIDSVRLRLVGESPAEVAGRDPCAGRAACRFSCSRGNGATPLDIPVGRYAISIEALDAQGNPLAPAIMTPAPILREVQWGQPTQLPALQIVAACSPRCAQNNSSVCGD